MSFQLLTTEYRLPNGQAFSYPITLKDEYFPYVKAMQNHNCAIEWEELLHTGELSVTITHEDEGDIDIILIPQSKVHFNINVTLRQAITELLTNEKWKTLS
jgi:hypothetical protein